MVTKQRSRNTKSIEFNEYLEKELKKHVGFDNDFNTFSDIVIHACTRLLIELRYEKEGETAFSVLMRMYQTTEGKELFEKIILTKKVDEIVESGIQNNFKVV